MRIRSSVAVAVMSLFVAACTTTSTEKETSRRDGADRPGVAAKPVVDAAAPVTSEDADGPSILKPPEEMTPAAVRAIEVQIDRRAVVMADDILIEVSKNYEWDVSLSGDAVVPQRPNGSGHASEAIGAARATVRNLDLRAKRRITFWRSGFDVKPFIRITARGNVSHVSSDDRAGEPRIRRASLCAVRDAALYFDDELLQAGLEIPTAAFER